MSRKHDGRHTHIDDQCHLSTYHRSGEVMHTRSLRHTVSLRLDVRFGVEPWNLSVSNSLPVVSMCLRCDVCPGQARVRAQLCLYGPRGYKMQIFFLMRHV